MSGRAEPDFSVNPNPAWLDALYLAPSLWHLAELHEAGGDRDRAAALYARFADLRAAADPPLQAQVALARTRIAVR